MTDSIIIVVVSALVVIIVTEIAEFTGFHSLFSEGHCP